MENLMIETASFIVTSVACLRKKSSVLIICGLHNKTFAEHIMHQSYVVGAYPYLWMFDENFLKHSNIISEDVIAVLPQHTRSLLEKSNVVIWLSQFEDFEKFPANFGMAISSFWDAVFEYGNNPETQQQRIDFIKQQTQQPPTDRKNQTVSILESDQSVSRSDRVRQ